MASHPMAGSPSHRVPTAAPGVGRARGAARGSLAVGPFLTVASPRSHSSAHWIGPVQARLPGLRVAFDPDGFPDLQVVAQAENRVARRVRHLSSERLTGLGIDVHDVTVGHPGDVHAVAACRPRQYLDDRSMPLHPPSPKHPNLPIRLCARSIRRRGRRNTGRGARRGGRSLLATRRSVRKPALESCFCPAAGAGGLQRSM